MGIIKKMTYAADRSSLDCLVALFPDMKEVVVQMGWEAVGPESGCFFPPSVMDMVLVGFAEGLDDQAFIIKRLTSKEDKIPVNVINGDAVLKALAGKKTWITGEKVNLTKGDAQPTENLVLGQVFKTAYSEDLDETSKHKHIGNLGYFTAVPDNAAKFSALKADPIDNEGVLSDVAFTEKG